MPTLVAASLAAALAGCGSLGGTLPRGAAEQPVDVPAKFSASGKAPLPEQWWRTFRDPALDALVARALAQNLGLVAARDRIAQAQAAARREGADLWPSLDGGAGGSRTREVLEVVGGPGVQYRSRRSAGFSANYELDVWGRVRAGRDAARYDAVAAGAEWQAAALAVAANVAAAWFQLVEQRGQVALAREQRATNAQVLELVNVRFQKGRVDAADVLRQRQLLESSTGNLAVAESRAAVLENALAVLTGTPPGGRAAPGSRLPALPPLPATGLPAELVQRRPDLRAAYAAVLAADRRLAAAKAERFPKLALSAGVDTQAARVRDLFDNWLATVAANLVAPLVDGGARQSEVERVRAAVSERLNEYGQAVLAALGEVEDALVQERQQRIFLASLERQLDLARQTLDRTRDSYTKGAVDYLRVLDALSTQQALERAVLTARRELAGFRVALCRALGGGWSGAGAPLQPPVR